MKFSAEPLGYHSHHSLNTHLVLTGRIAFFKKNPDLAPPISSAHPPPRRSFHINPPVSGSDQDISGLCDKYSGLITVKEGVVYRAGLETEECRFVEGHSVLSPTTRGRLILRGNIRWDDSVGTEDTGKVMREVREEGDVSDIVKENERARLERKEKRDMVRLAEEAERESLHGEEEGGQGVSEESSEEDGGGEGELSAEPKSLPEDLSDSDSDE
jgi:hypothetical protein